jgi:hypothetical protein
MAGTPSQVEIYADIKTLLNDYPGKTGKKWVVLRYL